MIEHPPRGSRSAKAKVKKQVRIAGGTPQELSTRMQLFHDALQAARGRVLDIVWPPRADEERRRVVCVVYELPLKPTASDGPPSL